MRSSLTFFEYIISSKQFDFIKYNQKLSYVNYSDGKPK